MKLDKKCDRVKRVYVISSECGVNSLLRSLTGVWKGIMKQSERPEAPVINK